MSISVDIVNDLAKWAVLYKSLFPMVFAFDDKGKVAFFIPGAFDFQMLMISFQATLLGIKACIKNFKISRIIVGLIIEKEIEEEKLEILLIIEMTKSDIFFKRVVLLEEGFEEDLEEDLKKEEKEEIKRIIENFRSLQQFIQT